MPKNDLALILTTRCNFHCKHCLREYYTEHHEPEMSLLKRVLLEAYDLGFDHVGITGGEPVLCPNFFELIEFLVENDFTWSVPSNGSLYKLYDQTIDIDRDAFKSIRLSFDGGTKATHDFIRQSGSFELLLEALEHYLEMGVKVGIAYTVNSKNIEEIDKIIGIAEEYSIDYLDFGAIIPAGHNLDLQVSWDQRLDVFERIQELREKEYPFQIGHANSLYASPGVDNFCKLINDHKPVINPFSEYVFCCDTVGQGAVLGSLKEEPFSNLYLKGLKKAAQVKRIRAELIRKKTYFKGFNSCHFCNLVLEDLVKKQTEYQIENQHTVEVDSIAA